MKLTKGNIKVEVFEITANYRRKTGNKPLLAILQLVAELGSLNAQILQRELLHNIPIQGCKNLLERYDKMGYLAYDVGDNSYTLTEIGQSSTKEKAVFEPFQGTLRVYLVTPEIPFFAQNYRVVKVEEVESKKGNRQDGIYGDTLPQKLKQLTKKYISLKDNTYYFEHIDSGHYQLEDKVVILTATQKGNATEFHLCDTISLENGLNLREEVLSNHFGERYQSEVVRSVFEGNIAFERTVNINYPDIHGVEFEKTSVKKVKYQPSNLNEAEKWRAALLKMLICQRPYFFDEIGFEAFEQECIAPFQNYFPELSPKGSEYWLDALEHAGLFYASAKLSTPQLLTF